MILLLFFCSGATALIYEVVRSKYLSLIFGASLPAFATLAAKTCRQQGDNEQAKRILLLGLELQPEASELRYLARIVAREEKPGTPPTIIRKL